MFCRRCGKQIPDDSDFCPGCGTNVESEEVILPKESATAQTGNAAPKEFVYVNQPLVGAYLDKPSRQPKKKSRAGLVAALVFLAFVIVALVINVIDANNKVAEGDIGGSSSAAQNDLAKSLGVSAAQSSAVLSILNQCGIDRIDLVTHDDMLDETNAPLEKGYRLKASGQNIILYLLSDGTVNQVRWADNDLYVDGAVVAKLTDYLISTKEATNIQINCEETVKGVLKSPSTAKFPLITEWAMKKTLEQIIVQGYVDSQNGFGAIIRADFQFILSPSGDTIISFIFDGKEMMR